MTNIPPPELEGFLDALAKTVDQILNGKDVATDKSLRRNGYTLLIYPYDALPTDERCNYISNGTTREAIVERFKTQIKKFEEQKMNGPT